MKQKIVKDNELSKKVKSWKDNQGMISLTLNELMKEVKGQDLFISEKIDGELTGMEFDGNESKFASKDGRLRWSMPVLEEITSILKKAKIKSALIFGEMAKVSTKGHPVNFNDTMSAIVKPEGDEEEHIDFFPFELYNLNNEKASDTFEKYKVSFKQLKNWFDKSKYVYPVDSQEAKVNDLKSAWNKWVVKEKNEGIVVRTSNGKIYKCKPLFTLDLGVIAIEEGTGKNKGKMGALILGFFDGENFYKVINLGVGFNDKDREDWWKLAKKYEIKTDSRMVWIDPFGLNKVIETKYERLNYRNVDTYQFDRKNKTWSKVDSKFAATISKPNFIRERTDKDVNQHDLRLIQLPDYEQMKKKTNLSINFFKFSEKLIGDFYGKQNY